MPWYFADFLCICSSRPTAFRCFATATGLPPRSTLSTLGLLLTSFSLCFLPFSRSRLPSWDCCPSRLLASLMYLLSGCFFYVPSSLPPLCSSFLLATAAFIGLLRAFLLCSPLPCPVTVPYPPLLGQLSLSSLLLWLGCAFSLLWHRPFLHIPGSFHSFAASFSSFALAAPFPPPPSWYSLLRICFFFSASGVLVFFATALLGPLSRPHLYCFSFLSRIFAPNPDLQLCRARLLLQHSHCLAFFGRHRLLLSRVTLGLDISLPHIISILLQLCIPWLRRCLPSLALSPIFTLFSWHILVF